MKSWQEIAKELQRYRDASIADIKPPVPKVSDDLPLNVTSIPDRLLSDSEIKITRKPAEKLVQELASGKLSCVDVVSAFLRRAGIAHKLTNCVTEVLPQAALARAKYLDDYLAEHKKPIGPLHGLPISVKEHIAMKGLAVNASFAGWYNNIATEDAISLQLLWKAGAVFYVRTTEPQVLMHLEASTTMYGTTVNPYNRNLTSGGSSGGEGALIALHGSCLGTGTDIGGSIRSPAANCGIWGFRPSSYRIPANGCVAYGSGEEQIVAVQGPMSASFEGLNMYMKAIIEQKPWLMEPSLLPLPWKFPPSESSFIKADGRKRLKVAVMWHDNVVRPHPPITRALQYVVDGLQKHPDQFEIVYWEPLKHDVSWDIITSLYFADGAKQPKTAMALANEPSLPLTKFIIDEQPNVREYSIDEVWKLTIRREAYRTEYLAHWNSTADSNGNVVDVILCPVGPGAAPPLEHSRYWTYTSVWNLLDYPAMVFPVTHVDLELDGSGGKDKGYQPMNGRDAWNWKLWTEGGAERYKDAPINLQLIGRRWHDENVFEAMTLINNALGI